jgi:hypothetical protein
VTVLPSGKTRLLSGDNFDDSNNSKSNPRSSLSLSTRKRALILSGIVEARHDSSKEFVVSSIERRTIDYFDEESPRTEVEIIYANA